MIKKIYLTLVTILFISAISFAANQSAMYFRNGGTADKTVLTLQALPDGTNNWSCSIPTTTLGTGSGQWFKFDASGNWTTNYNWGYAVTPAFNTSTALACNGSNGLITAVTGHTYGFTIKDVAASTASVGFVFDFTGTPATISSATASSATPGNPVTVTTTLNTSLATNQTIWIRYSIGSSTYGTSTITQMTGSGTSYTATIPGQTVGTIVYYYCFTSGTISGGVTTSNVTQATINMSTATSYTVATVPVLTATPSTLSGFSYFPGSGPSTSQSYSLSGQYLTGYPSNIALTSPTDYEVSTDNAAWSSSALVPFTSATLSATTIYVRLKAGLVQGNYNLENVTNAGGGATTVNVACSGSVLKFAPPNQSTGFTASIGSPSSTVIHFAWTDDAIGSPTPDGYLIRGSSVGYSSITPPVNGIPVASSGLDMNVAQGTQLANITGLSQGTTYYFYIYSYTNSGTNILYNLVGPQQSSATTTVTTYYSKSTGNLDLLSNWGANTDGSGSSPANFTTDGITFIIKNNLTPTIGGTWTISGATSKIQVGDGTAAINFSVPSTLTATNLDIMNNATLTLGSAITLTGTINVNSGGTLNCSTYILSGTAGIFNLNSGGKLMIGSPLGITTQGTASGNIQTTGTRTYNTAGKYVYNGTASQVTGNALPNPLASGGLLQISNTLGIVALSQYMAYSSGSVVLVDAGATLSTGSNGPTFNNGCTVTINGTYQIDQGGGTYTSGNIAFVYGTSGTFTCNYTSSQLGVYNNNPYWNNNTGFVATPPNVNIKGAGGISIQTSVVLTVNGTFQTSGPVAIINSGTALTINGTCQINTGGSFANSPSYGASSTLIYNKGGSVTRGNEWLAVTTGAGYPKHVQISNSTTLGMSTTAAQCAGNLTIDAGSTLNTTSNTLTVLGNVVVNGTLSLAGNMISNGNWTLSGTQTTNSKNVTFGGSSLQTITGPAAFDNLIINNVSGVSLGSACTVNSNLALTSGSLALAGNNLTVGGTISGTSSSNFIVTNGAGLLVQPINNGSTVLFPIGPSSSNYNPVTLTNNGTSDSYSVNVATGIGVHATGTNVVNRIWTIMEGASGGSNLKTTFGWNSGDEVGGPYNHSLFSIGVDNGTIYDWVVSGGVQDLGSGQYSITNSDNSLTVDLSGSGKTFMVGEGTSLPVELSSLASNTNGRNIQLNWETKTEKNSNKFEIQRSLINENRWSSIGSVKAADLSNSPKQYSYSDKNLQAGDYQYRLKMVDNDGTFEYSKVIEAVVALPKNFDLSQNYPNPFNPSTKINYSIPNDSKVILDIFSVSGEKVGQIVNEEQAAGYYTVDFGNSTIHKNLSSGIYIYRISVFDKTTGKGFNSIKKMILLK